MVAGGILRDIGSEIIEVIDIEDDTVVCDNLPEYPHKKLYKGMGGLLCCA